MKEQIRVNVGVLSPVKETAVIDRVKQGKIRCVGCCLDDVTFFSMVLIYSLTHVFSLFIHFSLGNQRRSLRRQVSTILGVNKIV